MNEPEHQFEGSQQELHDLLVSKGWRSASPSDYTKRPTLRREAEPQPWRNPTISAFFKKMRYYVHPDREDEYISTAPSGEEYSVWQHLKDVPGDAGTGQNRFLGGNYGRSGKRGELKSHLDSGAKLHQPWESAAQRLVQTLLDE